MGSTPLCRPRCLTLVVAVVAIAAVVVIAAPVAAQRAQYYVIDGFGGVHAGGGAPTINPGTPYFGFDVARDIAYVPYGVGGTAGEGVLVLDAFGGVHAGGALPGAQAAPRPPYFGFDVARGIAYRNVPTRASGSTGFGNATISTVSSTFTTISSASIVAPDDGFLLVTATANWGCTAATASNLGVEFSIDVNGTAGVAEADYDGFIDCGHGSAADSVSITRLLPVAAGAHTVNFLARKVFASGQFGNLAVTRSSVVVVYVDQAGDGSS